MVRRVAKLVSRRVRGRRVGRVGQRRLVLMMRRRRGRVRMMMVVRRHVHVAVVMRPGRAVYVVQQIVVRRQRVVLEVQDVRQQRLAGALVQLQVAVRLVRACGKRCF